MIKQSISNTDWSQCQDIFPILMHSQDTGHIVKRSISNTIIIEMHQYLSPPNGLGCCLFQGGGSVFVDSLLIVTPIVGFCNCSMFCRTLLYVQSSFAIILMGKRELIALFSLSSWCLLVVV